MSCEKIGCLMGGVDLREWAGVDVLRIGATTITLPAYTDSDGFFFDRIIGANGRGRLLGLQRAIQAGWTAAGAPGTLTLKIDPATRRFRLDASALTFDLAASADLAYLGFSTAGSGGLVLSISAIADYQSDFTTGAVGLKITPNGLPAFDVLTHTWVDCLGVEMRTRGTTASPADIDDAAPDLCFEAVLSASIAAAKFGIDADGYAVLAYPFTLADPTWLDAGFRDEWGFTGLETVSIIGQVKVIRAARRCPGIQMLAEGWDLERGVSMPGDAVETLAGSAESNLLGRFERLLISFQVTGPGHSGNDHLHWLRRVRPGAGEPLSFYPLGPTEPRRALDPYEVTADQLAEDLVYTDARQGYAGRFPARLAADASEDERVSFQGPTAIYSTPISVLLAVDEEA